MVWLTVSVQVMSTSFLLSALSPSSQTDRQSTSASYSVPSECADHMSQFLLRMGDPFILKMSDLFIFRAVTHSYSGRVTH